MTALWVCQTRDGSTTYHATESGALAEATLVSGSSKGECVVYQVFVIDDKAFNQLADELERPGRVLPNLAKLLKGRDREGSDE